MTESTTPNGTVPVGTRSIPISQVRYVKELYPRLQPDDATIDAYRMALEWNADYRHCMYAFCDLKHQAHYACWANDIPRPRLITVPSWRRDHQDTMERLGAAFPDILLQASDRGSGSGTAYFLVPKPRPGYASALRPLDLFVRHDVWTAVNGMEQMGVAG